MSDDIQRSLGRIEGKLDMTLDNIVSLEKKHDGVIQRVGSLEDTRNYAFGALAVVAGVFGVVGSFIGKAITLAIGVH